MTKSVCIHHSDDSTASMLFKNYLNDKIVFVRMIWQQILNVFCKMLQSNFLQMRICQTHQSVAGIQILEQMERYSKRVDDHLMESKEFPTKY